MPIVPQRSKASLSLALSALQARSPRRKRRLPHRPRTTSLCSREKHGFLEPDSAAPSSNPYDPAPQRPAPEPDKHAGALVRQRLAFDQGARRRQVAKLDRVRQPRAADGGCEQHRGAWRLTFLELRLDHCCAPWRTKIIAHSAVPQIGSAVAVPEGNSADSANCTMHNRSLSLEPRLVSRCRLRRRLARIAGANRPKLRPGYEREEARGATTGGADFSSPLALAADCAPAPVSPFRD
jgi:hypothetical protein